LSPESASGGEPDRKRRQAARALGRVVVPHDPHEPTAEPLRSGSAPPPIPENVIFGIFADVFKSEHRLVDHSKQNLRVARCLDT
jgi:hypothetical protein